MNLFETFVFKIYSCCKDEFPEVNAKTGTYRGIRQLSSGMFLFVLSYPSFKWFIVRTDLIDIHKINPLDKSSHQYYKIFKIGITVYLTK